MNAHRVALTVLLLVAVAAPVSAGIIFNRKPKVSPNDRVGQLVSSVKTEADDRKRAAAAEELRDFDPTKFPEVVNVLLDCALHDKAANVRAQAVHSLGKLRPISQQVGYALEQIVANDSSVRVQVQARSALVSYRISGYRGVKNGEPPQLPGPTKSEEPPLAEPSAKAAPQSSPPRAVAVPQPKATPSTRPGAEPPRIGLGDGPDLNPPK